MGLLQEAQDGLATALAGKPARAVALLEKAASTGLPNYPVFRDDPHVRPLHNRAASCA